MSIIQAYKSIILTTACQSIAIGRKTGEPFLPPSENIDPVLLAPGASFVTLEIEERLRGCIGSLEPRRALLTDIASNAYAAAFHDPRFPPVDSHELSQLHVTVSVLSEPERLECENEQDCLRQLRPEVDGLIISDNNKRATFLPSVWSSLSTPELFLTELKKKAGFAPDHWSASMQVSRYTTEHFSADYSEIIRED